MKIYNKILLTLLGALTITMSGCRDQMTDLNKRPDAIVVPNIMFLYTNAVMQFEASAYYYWFYNAPMMYNWNQMAVPTSSFNSNILTTTATGGQGGQYISILKVIRDVEYQRSAMPAEESAKYVQVASCLDVLSIYLGIQDMDMNGDIAYTEACKALYGGTLTPKIDRMQDLYTLWLSQLNTAINDFHTKPATPQILISKQDPVFQFQMDKWAKFANSLKLKIAVRLLGQDKQKALTIAKEVAASPAGYIDNLSESVLFSKASEGDQDVIYHWNQSVMEASAANQDVVNFMIKNADPRVRFVYNKNKWNSKIIQGFYDKKQAIPHFIEENVEYTTDAKGVKHFVAWKGMGEPWVRYYGLPSEENAASNAGKYGDYFDGSRVKLSDADGAREKSYLPYSTLQRQMIIGRRYNLLVPTLPDGPIIEKYDPRIWHGLYLGSAEVNLYLAELSLQGAALPKSAQAYYNAALVASVTEHDELARRNKIDYYDNTYDYDPNEKPIKLEPGEIETMMSKPDYQLTGSTLEQLEKVYVQQMLNFSLYPNDNFYTARRGGVPMIGSKLFPRRVLPSVNMNQLPRRFDSGIPLETDKMYSIMKKSLKDQGFTESTSGPANPLLNSERIWNDKKHPQWGAGPRIF